MGNKKEIVDPNKLAAARSIENIAARGQLTDNVIQMVCENHGITEEEVNSVLNMSLGLTRARVRRGLIEEGVSSLLIDISFRVINIRAWLSTLGGRRRGGDKF